MSGEVAGGRTAISGEERPFLPGMRRNWLLPLYDPLTRLLGIRRVHVRLLGQAGVRPGHRVLEIGCGTGNLLLAAKRSQPAATVVGVDPDLTALARAQRKAHRRGLAVQLDRGYADELPYADDSVDVVLSSFMLHHVPADRREPAMREVRRVLRPGGALHLVDIGGADAHADGWIARRAHRHELTEGEVGGGIPDLLRRAGFLDVSETGSDARRHVGRFTFYRARA
ncbi:class I SAM-dependent methyltransferase [Blastococcus sp. CT_GayMR19]|uniref:class I SAM-dependent methyltransferase n=1 Tax=Blastococcus sp. CT_GayMR19 TaxID=2559608 RepID=UPI001ADDB4DA|nr:class I SAM-dependent methyltransferase [Blastococcus sp. CT_GayMR19]